jgi:hypothetical protein
MSQRMPARVRRNGQRTNTDVTARAERSASARAGGCGALRQEVAPGVQTLQARVGAAVQSARHEHARRRVAAEQL